MLVNAGYLGKGNSFASSFLTKGNLPQLKKMKRIAVITTKISANYPDVDFDALKQKEMPFIKKWQEQGVLESFFIKSDTNGAVLVFKDLDMAQVVSNIEHLPFFPYLENVEYLELNKIF